MYLCKVGLENGNKVFVFEGLTNLNDGFDSGKIKYFSEPEFRIVLQRVEQLKIGILGIEPWQDGEYFGVSTYEDHFSQPNNPEWYWKAFENFVEMKENLQYAASYKVSKELLKNKKVWNND